MSKFTFLNQSGCYEVENINDKELMDSVIGAFKSLSFTEEEVDAVWSILSIILNMGNIEIDTSVYLEGAHACKLKSSEALTNVLELLEVQPDDLEEAMLNKVRLINGKRILSEKNPKDCASVFDAFAKELFNKLFHYMVIRCNATILPYDVQQNKDKYKKIGLLDIFGFENFDVNSLEQFCINYTNEKLQHLYIQYVFKNEKAIFAAEGLSEYVSVIRYTDNTDIVALMGANSNPQGIFNIIDSCVTSNQDSSSLLLQLSKLHSGNDKLIIGRLMAKDSFKIKHTARTVKYDTSDFVEKNKDELPPAVIELVYNAKNSIARVWQGKTRPDDETEHQYEIHQKNIRKNYLGYKFREEMEI